MPRKSEASTNRNGGSNDDGTQFDEMSIDLECNCCCGMACSGTCGCHSHNHQVTRSQLNGTADAWRAVEYAMVPSEPRDILHDVAMLSLSTSEDHCISIGDNSFEVTPLTHANLAQHSSSLEREDRFEHVRRCVEDEDDVIKSVSGSILDGEDLPAGEMDESLLEASMSVQLEPSSDSKSRLSSWDRSFARSSPSASIYLRETGAKHHFKGKPLPLLEEHSHSRAASCRCGCDV